MAQSCAVTMLVLVPACARSCSKHRHACALVLSTMMVVAAVHDLVTREK
jgi:hypothetical protein